VSSPDVVALFPWGDLIEDDYLDRIGVTLDDFRTTFRGSWMFGYVEALRRNHIETLLVVFSRRTREPLRFIHEPTAARVTILPAPRRAAFLRLWRRITRRLGLADTPIGRFFADCASYGALPLFRVARELRRERVTAILCQEYEYQRFDLLVLLGRWLRLPVFATFQGGGERRLGAIERFARRWAMRRCAGIVAGSAAECERVRNRYGTDVRIAMIPNAVDVEYWSAVDASAARAVLDLPPGAGVAAWHGRIEIEPKGLDVLLSAWDAVVKDDRFLLIVGGGGDAARFREMVAARKNVRWTSSFVGDPAMIRTLLSAADVYVFPSRREGFPVSPIEALAASLPLVASDALGLREIVGSGDDAAGIIVPSGNVAATAAAIETLFADPSARARARGRAAARAQLFGLDAVGRQLRAFFFPLLGSRE
jgi:glycosyltransferase involved in cell wall biosynthesis